MTATRGVLAKEMHPWQRSFRPADPGSLDFLLGYIAPIRTAGTRSKSPAFSQPIPATARLKLPTAPDHPDDWDSAGVMRGSAAVAGAWRVERLARDAATARSAASDAKAKSIIRSIG
jgi:hypothetical protein